MYAFVPNHSGKWKIEIDFSHRSEKFEQIVKETKQLLKEKTGIPKEYEILFIGGSATAAIETIFASLLIPQVEIETKGEFGYRMQFIAKNYTAITEGSEWFAYVQFETSKSLFSSCPANKKHTIIDAVSGFPYYEFPEGDIVVLSSSKLLGGLPVMGIICAKPEIRGMLQENSYYLNLKRIWEYAERNQTPHTSLMPQIISLHQSLQAFNIERLKERIRENSRVVSKGLEGIGEQIGEKVAPMLTFSYQENGLPERLYKAGFEVYHNKAYLREKKILQIATYNYPVGPYKKLIKEVKKYAYRRRVIRRSG